MKINEIPLSEVKNIALEILTSNFFSKYFSMRQLRDEVIVRRYDIELHDLKHDERYNDTKMRIGKQLVYLFREFQKKEYINKYSNRFWQIRKDNIKKEFENGKKEME